MHSALKSSSPMSFYDDSRFDPNHYLNSPPEEPMLFDFDDSAFFIAPGYDESHPVVDDMPPSPAYELAPAYSADPFAIGTKSRSTPHPPTSPIPIPSSPPNHNFLSYNDNASPFSHDAPFSPLSLAAALPLPSSFSPSSSFDDHHHYQLVDPISVSPRDTQPAPPQVPQWAAQLWDAPTPPSASSSRMTHVRTASSPRFSPLSEQRRRRNSQTTSGLLSFPTLSSSAPSGAPPMAVGHNTIRAYSSKRAESFGGPGAETVDKDATITGRRRKRAPSEEADEDYVPSNNPPQKSFLRPPKLAPSAWQLYFTDWIARHQKTSNRKLNVAQAAKEAGLEYAGLSEEEKEPYKQRSQAAKEVREREMNAYLRSLTPEDIKRENAFRSAQRKAGKSRKSNIKDPNAPKKPLSAYFMFLQRIRADPVLVKEIFGDETETTKQSVLAAAKWRSMTDDERKPFLAQAEQEKMEYEEARRLYEDGTGSPGYGHNFNFSVLTGSPAAFPAVKLESESEGESDAFGHGPRHLRFPS
ncbi:hypothetical protein MKEN_00112700 [Mycena kentingensis (nom. inval.)]|nr:hypothetical protein MKEN_00112700 [Mycena kentingensis (nom. inval.)]